MAFEDIKAGLAALMDEIMKRPEDRHVLQEQLREKISELESMGLPVPEDYKRFEDELSEDEADEVYDGKSGHPARPKRTGSS